MSIDRNDALYHCLNLDFGDCQLNEEQTFACNHLLSTILKKNVDCIADDAKDKAKALFLELNERCRQYRVGHMHEHEYVCYSLMKEKLYTWTHEPKRLSAQRTFSTSAIMNLGDFGPGSSVGTRETSYLGKLANSVLTCTTPEVRRHWSLFTRGSVRSYLSEHEREKRFGPVELVQGSKFSTVDKTRDIARCIATEPSVNMHIQKGIAACLARSLRRYTGIDFALQQGRARRLARLGSIDGSFATIDLSSASDTISLRLMSDLLSDDFFLTLLMPRSKYCLVDKQPVKLFMMSSMGNGYTSSLQTMLFTSLVLSAYELLGIPIRVPNGKRDGNFSVFGDDMVVEAKAFPFIITMLEKLGMIPSKTKSFNSGDFRESCGADYFRGHNVRGVYNKSLYETHNLYATINLLTLWSARNGVPLVATNRLLRDWVPAVFIPFEAAEGANSVSGGIMTLRPPVRRNTPKRNKWYANGSIWYRRLLLTDETRSLEYYERNAVNGLLHAALKGALMGGKLVVRLNRQGETRFVWCLTPNWSYVSDATYEMFDIRGRASQLENICELYYGNSTL